MKEILFHSLSIIVIIASLLPFSKNQHWFVRLGDFVKVHLFVCQALLFIVGFFVIDYSLFSIVVCSLLLFLLIHNIFILAKYTPLFKKRIVNYESSTCTENISIVAANVFQFNHQYQSFINLVEKVDPHLILTVESNRHWEEGLKELEEKYPNCWKIPQENTYGMHLYTKLKIKEITTHYFVADDIPSIEAKLLTEDGEEFVFFGIHPPPPSPTEEANSKERDGELLCVAKHISSYQCPIIVVGDFNNVPWSKSSRLFQKTANLLDARIGRGLISTFHAKYKLLRMPIDQLYHSAEIHVVDLRTLAYFGSDHFPIFCKFFIQQNHATVNNKKVEKIDKEEQKEVDNLIAKGKQEEGDREKEAKE